MLLSVKIMYIKAGKKTKEWNKARAVLKKEYMEMGIMSCELRFDLQNSVTGCTGGMFLGFAHRYKRNDPRCEHTFEKTILACTYCHQIIEYHKELSEKCFNQLRGESVGRNGCQNLLIDMRSKEE